MVFDNNDSRIRYVELQFMRSNLHHIPKFELPEGYHFTFYQPGDKDTWIAIEKSAKEFSNYEQGINAWNRYFAGKEDLLFNRMVFIETDFGEKVATASAYYDIYGNDKTGAGWLHWVAIRREYQGRGLAKPLISYALRMMPGLGYDHAMLSSQTNTWLACKIYLDFGFVPHPHNAEQARIGWNILKTITNHPALLEFDTVPESAIFQSETI